MPHRLLPLIALLWGCTRQLAPDVRAPRRDPAAGWSALLDEIAAPASEGEGASAVDYAELAARREVLDGYLAWVGEHGPDSDGMRHSQEDRKLAFYLNAYNAAVLYAVLENAPLQSVKDVSVGPYPRGGAGFFHGQEFRVDGEWVSLFFLEQQYVLALFEDPLAHMALNCASAGCPPVRYWREAHLDSQLEQAARDFLASPAGLRKTADGYAASEIFSWYEDHFLDWGPADTLCEWMGERAEGDARAWLQANAEDCPLTFFAYDWSLNAATPPPPR